MIKTYNLLTRQIVYRVHPFAKLSSENQKATVEKVPTFFEKLYEKKKMYETFVLVHG